MEERPVLRQNSVRADEAMFSIIWTHHARPSENHFQPDLRLFSIADEPRFRESGSATAIIGSEPTSAQATNEAIGQAVLGSLAAILDQLEGSAHNCRTG
jgi:hypothetical protein